MTNKVYNVLFLCTAMVFVWGSLPDGEPHFTLTQVALNDTIMVLAFVPVVGLLLGISAITVPWDTLFLSVVLYIVIPVAIAQAWRSWRLRAGGDEALEQTQKTLGPVYQVALLATLVLLFGFQGEQILSQPLIILLIAVPILIQVYFNSGLVLDQHSIDGYRTTHSVQDKAQPCRHSHSMSNGCNAVLGAVCDSLRAGGKWLSAVLPAFGCSGRMSSLELATASPAFVRLAASRLEQPKVGNHLPLRRIYQYYVVRVLAYWLNRQFGVAHCVVAPSAIIGASNFFLNSRWLRPSSYSGSIPGRLLRLWSAYSLRYRSCCLLYESSTAPKVGTSPA